MKKLCLLILFALSACMATPPPEPVTMKVGFGLWPGYYPLFVAKEQGLYAQNGIQLQDKIYGDISEVVKDLQTHQLDVGLATLSDALVLDSRQAGEYKVILITDYSNGSDMVIARPEITTIADLRGKRIGVSIGTFGELLVRKMLETENLTIDDVILVNTNASEIPKAIPTLIDAGQTFEPHVTEATAKGNKVLFSSAAVPGLIADVVIVRTEFIKQHPEAMRAFIKIWFEAQAYWQAHPAESNEIIAKAAGLNAADISTDGIKLLNLAENLQAFTKSNDTLSMYGSGEINRDFLLDAGIVNTVPEVDRVLEPAFLSEK